MLTDVLGVLIAFISIILLLSMIVTAMVQTTQSLLRLRGRNLKEGVRSIVKTYSPMTNEEAREKAVHVLNENKIAAVDKIANPNSRTNRMLGPKVTWARPQDLAAAIHTELQSSKQAIGNVTEPQIQEDIEKMEPAWSKRFAYFIRLITLGWAVIIAVVFQVSVPDLFSALSKDPARVQLIVSQTDEILKDAKAALAEDEYDLISDKALDQLTEKYPNYKDQIEQAGNAAPTKELLLQQLADVLPNDPERSKILTTYSMLIDELSQQRSSDSGPNSANAIERLSVFGIQYWKYGNEFYVTSDGGIRWQSVGGVLVTVILLSFGAPFWFDRLRDLAQLRDLRAPK